MRCLRPADSIEAEPIPASHRAGGLPKPSHLGRAPAKPPAAARPRRSSPPAPLAEPPLWVASVLVLLESCIHSPDEIAHRLESLGRPRLLLLSKLAAIGAKLTVQAVKPRRLVLGLVAELGPMPPSVRDSTPYLAARLARRPATAAEHIREALTEPEAQAAIARTEPL